MARSCVRKRVMSRHGERQESMKELQNYVVSCYAEKCFIYSTNMSLSFQHNANNKAKISCINLRESIFDDVLCFIGSEK